MKSVYIIPFIATVLTTENIPDSKIYNVNATSMGKIIMHRKLCNNKLKLNSTKKYEPDWKSLDKRPLPGWYDKAKIGIFLQWGVYSVPSYNSEWIWHDWEKNDIITNYIKNNFHPHFTYQSFGSMFGAEFFEPEYWAKVLSKAGARYVVLTSKHHEGFTLFPSKRSFSWNSVEVGPKRDLVGELATAVRAEGLKFGLYYSLYEWNHPIYLADKNRKFKSQDFVNFKVWPELKQIVNEYKPSVIWSDGDWEASVEYWKSREFLAWLYNESPIKDEVVVNDRWGAGTPCQHGDFFNCADRYNPGKLQPNKWENVFSIDRQSWGYRKNLRLGDIMTFFELLEQVVSTVSCGGNALINVGPTSEGTIIPIFQERLLSLGEWLSRNGEAIYESSPWKYQKDSYYKENKVWYTCVRDPSEIDVLAIYIIILEKRTSNTVKLKDISEVLESEHEVQLIENVTYTPLTWYIDNEETLITLPPSYPDYPVLKIQLQQ